MMHITTGEGEPQVHNEEHVRTLWMAGQLPAGTLYWKEGMTEWLPLGGLFPATAVYEPMAAARAGGQNVAGSPFQSTASGGYRFVKDPAVLTKVLTVLLWLGLGLSVISILSDFAQMNLLQGSYTDADIEANDSRQGIIGLTALLLYLVTGITFLIWTSRACKNSHGFGARGMEFTPGWAAGWFFVPFMNLVRPYQVMREIWQVSVDPRNWQSFQAPAILKVWWGLWLTSNFLGQISFRLHTAVEDIPSLTRATVVAVIASAIDIVLTLAVLRVIGQIYRQQKELVE